jgi:hypothetical protein
MNISLFIKFFVICRDEMNRFAVISYDESITPLFIPFFVISHDESITPLFISFVVISPKVGP